MGKRPHLQHRWIIHRQARIQRRFLLHVSSDVISSSLLAFTGKFSSQRLLLLAYFTSALIYSVVRGRPTLNVRSFYKNTEDVLHKAPGLSTEPARGTLLAPWHLWFGLNPESMVPNDPNRTSQRTPLQGATRARPPATISVPLPVG